MAYKDATLTRDELLESATPSLPMWEVSARRTEPYSNESIASVFFDCVVGDYLDAIRRVADYISRTYYNGAVFDYKSQNWSNTFDPQQRYAYVLIRRDVYRVFITKVTKEQSND